MLKSSGTPKSKRFSRRKMMGDFEDRSKLKMIHAAGIYVILQHEYECLIGYKTPYAAEKIYGK